MWLPQPFDAYGALGWAQFIQTYLRSGVDGSGTDADVSLASSSTDITLSVNNGPVQVAGTSYSLASQQITLPDNNGTTPRMDVVWVDSTGGVTSTQGQGAVAASDVGDVRQMTGETLARRTYRPWPPVPSAHPDVCVLAAVWVPAGATSSDDLVAGHVLDRRVSLVQIDGLTTSEGDSRYVNVDGDDMTGALSLNGDAYGTQVWAQGAHSLMNTWEVSNTTLQDTEQVEFRQRVPSGKTLYLFEASVRTDAETTPTGLTIEAYDVTNAASIYSVNSAFTEGDPLASKSGAFDVEFRVVNSTGGEVGANGRFKYSLY